ncbi:unnamed protein product, partial [Closterium sp. NIES-64]
RSLLLSPAFVSLLNHPVNDLVSPYLCFHFLADALPNLLCSRIPHNLLPPIFPASLPSPSPNPQCNDLVSPYLCFHSLADATLGAKELPIREVKR